MTLTHEPLTGFSRQGTSSRGAELNYYDQDLRQHQGSQPVAARNVDGGCGNRGLFPIVREVTVAETGVPSTLHGRVLTSAISAPAAAGDRSCQVRVPFASLQHPHRQVQNHHRPSRSGLGCFKLGMETVAYNQPKTVTSQKKAPSLHGLLWQTGLTKHWFGRTGKTAEEVTLQFNGNQPPGV